MLNYNAMKIRIALVVLSLMAALCLSCKTKEKEEIGAAGRPEEMADSTRLDSAVTDRGPVVQPADTFQPR